MKNLFGFGNKSEKKTAKVLGPLLASLFGAEEGQEMVVDATESGLAAIEAAESTLEEYSQTMEAAQGRIDELEAQVSTLQEENTTLSADRDQVRADFEAFKKGPAASHTVVTKDEDTINDDPKPAGSIPEYKKEEARIRAIARGQSGKVSHEKSEK